jgi:DNA-binding phage protein
MAQDAHLVISLLTCIHDAVAVQKTNAYQISKATGIPLRSIQILLKQKSNPTLRNVHLLLAGLGLELYVINVGTPAIKPGRTARIST